MVVLSNLFSNPNVGLSTNSMMWWAWESIIHHLYFIFLWVQRQFSQKWDLGDAELWKLNMEKECEFFENLFGGDSILCAQGSIKTFAGLWFRTDKPVESQLVWIGRIIANYQQLEAIAHVLIVVLGFAIVLILSGEKKDRYGSSVPAWIRWSFFITMLFEVAVMCVPYSGLFTWALLPFMNVDGGLSPLASTIKEMGDGDDFLKGIQLGAALITFTWVSHVVLLLDSIALLKAWWFAMNGSDTILINILFWGVTSALVGSFYVEFWGPHGRGYFANENNFSTRVLDGLHHLFGTDQTPMAQLVNISTTSLLY